MSQILAAPVPITAADYSRLPDDGPRCELIEGDLFMAPSPYLFHQEISSNIEHILYKYLAEHPVGKVFHAPLDVFLDNANVYQPDILFVSSKNFRMLKKGGVHGAPDLVVEILSPSTSRRDLGVKKRMLATHGTVEFWAVHPAKRTVDVFALQQSEGSLGLGGKAISSKAICCPGCVSKVARFFAR